MMAVTDYGAGADTSAVELGYVLESSWGTTPSSVLTNLRVTSESLNPDETTAVSDEIRADGQIIDVLRTGISASGGFGFNLSYGEFDPFFAGALRGAWASVWSNTLTVTIADSGSNSEISDDGTGGVLGVGITVGSYIRISGLTSNSDEDGFYKVMAITDSDTIEVYPQLTAAASESSVTLDNDGHLRNASAVSSFTLEKAFTDVTQFFSFTGMVIDTMSLTLDDGIISGNFDFLGKAIARATSTVGSGSATAAGTNRVLTTADNIAGYREANAVFGDASSSIVTSFSLNVANNLRGQRGHSSAYNQGIGKGRIVPTGSISMYFKNGSIYDKWLARTQTSLDTILTDDNGNTYIIGVPGVRLMNPNIVAGGTDQDVIASFDYQGVRHSTFGHSISIDRFATAS